MDLFDPLALLPFVIVASAAVGGRFPAASTVTAFALTGAHGSLDAFTGLSAATFRDAVDVILIGLWIGLVISRLIAVQRRMIVWLSIVAVGLYVAVTVLTVVTATEVTASLLSFRLSAWHLLVIVLVAYAGWNALTYRRIARGVVLVGALVGAYAALRWQIGPAPAELTRASEVAGDFNLVQGELAVFGSFNARHQLGFWAGVVGPFCLAAALGWTGRWRTLAGVAFLLLVLAVLVSGVRGGLVGLVVGSGLVIGLFQLARGIPGLRLGRTAAIGATCAVVIAGGLLFTTGASEGLSRYTAILSPAEDVAYDARQRKWAEAMPDIQAHPFGQGVGSASLNPAIRGPYLSPATFAIDSSYLKIAYEQGLAVMALFALALLLLLAQLAIASVRATRADTATMGMGAAGTLAATMVVFYTDMQFEGLTSLAPWLITGLGAAFLIAERSGGHPVPSGAGSGERGLAHRDDGGRGPTPRSLRPGRG